MSQGSMYMYKNQLQEFAQKGHFNLPTYKWIRTRRPHAPLFKATVTFNGEEFHSPESYCTVRQAEHAVAKVALDRAIANQDPYHESLAPQNYILDESKGICKSLLQELAQRTGVAHPEYTTTQSGPEHQLVFTCKVMVGSMTFEGKDSTTKKQAEQNAALVAWSALKECEHQGRDVDTRLIDEGKSNMIQIRSLPQLHTSNET